MPSPAVLRILGFVYCAVSALLWPLTTIISTAFALKLKIPKLPALGPFRRRGLTARIADS
jgi:hypothetical protein